DAYVFQVAVQPGTYVVRALVGDLLYPSWQSLDINGVEAGTYELPANRFAWTPTVRLTVGEEKQLRVRIAVRADNTPAGISELVYVKVD
ncbi:MAG: hypothetical protein EA425_10390, partial [Puniceicoccaceae bacterium]